MAPGLTYRRVKHKDNAAGVVQSKPGGKGFASFGRKAFNLGRGLAG
jgi:hypothetical protein